MVLLWIDYIDQTSADFFTAVIRKMRFIFDEVKNLWWTLFIKGLQSKQIEISTSRKAKLNTEVFPLNLNSWWLPRLAVLNSTPCDLSHFLNSLYFIADNLQQISCIIQHICSFYGRTKIFRQPERRITLLTLLLCGVNPSLARFDFCPKRHEPKSECVHRVQQAKRFRLIIYWHWYWVVCYLKQFSSENNFILNSINKGLKKYLTQNPKTPVAIELKIIALTWMTTNK